MFVPLSNGCNNKISSILDKATEQAPGFEHQKCPLIKQWELKCYNICTDHETRHPSRWRQVIKCRTVKRKPEKSLKDVILALCDQRNDEWSNDVKQRVQSAVSDLYAANVRYHKSCIAEFGYISTSGKNKQEDHDQEFRDILTIMEQKKSTIYNFIEIYQICKSKGGFTFSRKSLI